MKASSKQAADYVRLLQYAARFYDVKANPQQKVTLTLDEVASFAEQLRAGCWQDTLRLIDVCLEKNKDLSAAQKAVFIALKHSMLSAGIAAWGLPNCNCGKVGCTYCIRPELIEPRKKTRRNHTAALAA